MKRMKHLIICMLAACCLTHPSTLTASEPTAPRKKVGVVLSGGGAKGMAHIGALRVIEEAGIPIDLVVGTSMGSIIGGLYSIGYTSTQLDSMVRKQDWPFLLSDRVPRSEQNMDEREVREKYVISVPIGKGEKVDATGGLIKGQNLANLFSQLTVGYHDSLDFHRLPIPFACVALNIVNGEEVDFHSGVLPTAMRASMAIPGVFTPVRLDSMVLVDGGVINNYPVNVARAMGADIVIGVDVQSELRPSSQLTSTKDVLGQLIGLMGKDLNEQNVDDTDTYIKVNVEGYSAASFTLAAIDTLIRRGREAAEAQLPQLNRLRKRLGLPDPATATASREGYPCSADRQVPVRQIIFEGLDPSDKKWLLKRCELEEDTLISIPLIEKAVVLMCSTLGYSNATYSLPLAEDGEGYNLHFQLSKKVENRVSVGLRFDSEEIASVQVNATAHFRRRTPSTLSLTARLGKRYAARIDYSIEPAPLQNVGLAYMFQYNDIDLYHRGEKSHNATFRYHLAELSYSNVWHRNVRFAVGLRYELYDYDRFLHQDGGSDPLQAGTDHFFSYFAQLHYETFDKAYFPSKGVSARASYSLYTDNFTEYDDHSPFSAIRGYCEGVVRVTRRFSMLPGIYGRFLIGRDIPYAKMNVMGGDVPGRYISQQLPFVGIRNAELQDNALLIGSLKLRQRMGNIHYLTLAANYALSAHKWKGLLEEDTQFGIGVGYGIDSMFGPLEASLGYTNRTKKGSLYLNLGFKF